MIARLSDAVVVVGASVFVAVGAMGVLAGAFEFTWITPLDLSSLGEGAPTFHAQQRFLKALELSVGLLLLAVRRRIWTDPAIRAAVLALFWATPLARLVSVPVDGLPEPGWVALMGVEIAGATVLTVRAVAAPRTLSVPGRG